MRRIEHLAVTVLMHIDTSFSLLWKNYSQISVYKLLLYYIGKLRKYLEITLELVYIDYCSCHCIPAIVR